MKIQTVQGKLWEKIMNEVLDENGGEMNIVKLNEETDKRFLQRGKNATSS